MICPEGLNSDFECPMIQNVAQELLSVGSSLPQRSIILRKNVNVLCQISYQEIVFSYIKTNCKVQGRMLVDKKNFVDSNPLLAKLNTWKGGDTDLDTLCCGRPCDMWAQRLNFTIKTDLVGIQEFWSHASDPFDYLYLFIYIISKQTEKKFAFPCYFKVCSLKQSSTDVNLSYPTSYALLSKLKVLCLLRVEWLETMR